MSVEPMQGCLHALESRSTPNVIKVEMYTDVKQYRKSFKTQIMLELSLCRLIVPLLTGLLRFHRNISALIAPNQKHFKAARCALLPLSSCWFTENVSASLALCV